MTIESFTTTQKVILGSAVARELATYLATEFGLKAGHDVRAQEMHEKPIRQIVVRCDGQYRTLDQVVSRPHVEIQVRAPRLRDSNDATQGCEYWIGKIIETLHRRRPILPSFQLLFELDGERPYDRSPIHRAWVISVEFNLIGHPKAGV